MTKYHVDLNKDGKDIVGDGARFETFEQAMDVAHQWATVLIDRTSNRLTIIITKEPSK